MIGFKLETLPEEARGFVQFLDGLTVEGEPLFSKITEFNRRPFSGYRSPVPTAELGDDRICINWFTSSETIRLHGFARDRTRNLKELLRVVQTEIQKWTKSSTQSSPPAESSAPVGPPASSPSDAGDRLQEAMEFFSTHPYLLKLAQDPSLVFRADELYRSIIRDGWIIEVDDRGPSLRRAPTSTS